MLVWLHEITFVSSRVTQLPLRHHVNESGVGGRPCNAIADKDRLQTTGELGGTLESCRSPREIPA